MPGRVLSLGSSGGASQAQALHMAAGACVGGGGSDCVIGATPWLQLGNEVEHNYFRRCSARRCWTSPAIAMVLLMVAAVAMGIMTIAVAKAIVLLTAMRMFFTD